MDDVIENNRATDAKSWQNSFEISAGSGLGMIAIDVDQVESQIRLLSQKSWNRLVGVT